MRAIHLAPAREAPILSICVPTWNRANRLADLLDAIGAFLSADRSSRDRVEIVVVENGSTDDTVARLQRFAATHPDIAFSCWSNEVNLGADVNYLRVLEHARGRWSWLIGDDEAIDPARIPALLAALENAADVLVLYDRRWNIPGIACPCNVDLKTFLDPAHDELGHMINQVGVFVLERPVVLHHLRRAYAQGIGYLHAYAFLTLGSLVDGGTMGLVEIPGLVRSGVDAPRWNVIGGQLGAWRSSVAALGNVGDLPRRRESRLRAWALTVLALFQIAQTGRPDPGVASWMMRSFAWRHKPQALAIAVLAALPRSLAGGLVRLAFRARGKAVPRLQQNDGY